MHKTSIHVSLKEIRGLTHSNSRNHTKNKGTKNKHEKDHEIHNAESSIQTRKDSQGPGLYRRFGVVNFVVFFVLVFGAFVLGVVLRI
jgi:hypothetical protein